MPSDLPSSFVVLQFVHLAICFKKRFLNCSPNWCCILICLLKFIIDLSNHIVNDQLHCIASFDWLSSRRSNFCCRVYDTRLIWFGCGIVSLVRTISGNQCIWILQWLPTSIKTNLNLKLVMHYRTDDLSFTWRSLKAHPSCRYGTPMHKLTHSIQIQIHTVVANNFTREWFIPPHNSCQSLHGWLWLHRDSWMQHSTEINRLDSLILLEVMTSLV